MAELSNLIDQHLAPIVTDFKARAEESLAGLRSAIPLLEQAQVMTADLESTVTQASEGLNICQICALGND